MVPPYHRVIPFRSLTLFHIFLILFRLSVIAPVYVNNEAVELVQNEVGSLRGAETDVEA